MKPAFPSLSRLRTASLLPLLLVTVGSLPMMSCAASSPRFPVVERAPYSNQVPSESWLGLADAAAERKDWEEAGMWLDRHATLPEVQLDSDFWHRRALYADQAGDPFRAAEVRQFLLRSTPEDLWLRIDLADDLQQSGRDLEAIEVLEFRFNDPEHQVYAWSASVELMLQSDRQQEAAIRCEQLAGATEGTVARDWWQRASSLHERLGDLPRATVCLENALEGVRLRKGEERVVQRLHALQLGEPENVSDALLLLRHHTEPAMRLNAIQYLSEQTFAQEVGTFEFALQDPAAEVVQVALKELGKRSVAGRCDAVLPMLAHENQEVVLEAIHALGALGTEREIPALLGAMVPDDRARFRATRQALQNVTGHRVSTDLDPGVEQRHILKGQWMDWLTALQAGKLER